MRYLIYYSYDGKDFNGYQKQNGLRTIQEELEKALKFINAGVDTVVTASGRTDKGVHANLAAAHFDLSVDITEYKLKRALNSNLPDDIHVISAQMVDNQFHARYMVKEKEYKYYLNMGEYNPTRRFYEYQYCKMLDTQEIEKAIKYFKGEHNFKSFTPNKDRRNNYVRTITDCYIEVMGNTLIFTFRGNGFLKYQIRNMVGYLIRVGEHKKRKEDIPKILEKKDRKCASITAHPEGLYLNKVVY